VDRRGRRTHQPLLRRERPRREAERQRPRRGPTGRLDFARREVRWSRRVPLDTHLANIGSHSILLVHGEDASAAFLAEEREHLLRTFPDGIVEEVYEVILLLATS
jgi:hypothetical protein